MKYIFIVNVKAGGRNSKEEIVKQIENLKKVFDYEIYETKAPKDATSFVKRYCKQHKSEACFVACGGDGTLNEVLNGMVDSKNKHLAILSFGSGNDFVKCYPDKNFLSVENLLNGKPEKIDIIKVNKNYAINVCNVGFEASACNYANKIKEKGGKNSYTKGLIKALFNSRFNKIDIIADGEKLTKGRMLLCTIANGRFVGGKYCCAPRSLNNDGELDVCLINSISLLRFIRSLKSYETGTHLENPLLKGKLFYRRAKHVEVSSKKQIEVCLDGEIIYGKKFSFDVIENGVSLILPQNN